MIQRPGADEISGGLEARLEALLFVAREPLGVRRLADLLGEEPPALREAIAALVHGAFDLALIRETDLRRAVESGLIDLERFSYEPAGPAAPSFALLAGPRLSGRARNAAREAALNLDHYRFDRSQRRVAAVVAAMGQLGLSGFAPVEPLPALRP